MPRLFRVVIQVSNIDEATDFYQRLLGVQGVRVSPGRHYFNCEGTILACYDPVEDGDVTDSVPNADFIYIAVGNLEKTYERAKALPCSYLEPEILSRPWGERSFYAKDPFGNHICFVDERTVFTG